MTLYSIVLFAHSWLRWVALVLAVLVLVRSFAGWRQQQPWRPLDERLHVFLVATIDTQLLLGLLLYAFLSPLSMLFWQDIGAAMKESSIRFYGVEHVFSMILAIAVLHIGRARSKRAASDTLQHRLVFLTVLVALVLIAIGIPWPGLPYGRALFRAF